jgi:RimJ/RimL family protein N-acetyltransferase
MAAPARFRLRRYASVRGARGTVLLARLVVLGRGGAGSAGSLSASASFAWLSFICGLGFTRAGTDAPVDGLSVASLRGRSMAVGSAETCMVCTDRLRLRLLRAEDAAALREVLEPESVEAAARKAGDRSLSPWVVTLRDGGAIIGFCGFFLRPVKGTTMGYGILPEYRGRGLATEAAKAVVDWAERHDVEFYSSIRPPNPASVRVLTKIGMYLVDSYIDEDGLRDVYRR